MSLALRILAAPVAAKRSSVCIHPRRAPSAKTPRCAVLMFRPFVGCTLRDPQSITRSTQTCWEFLPTREATKP